MTTLQKISSKWEVVQILAEEDHEPSTVNIYGAKIDPKCASALIRHLSIRAPLQSLGHVKRIRRVMKEGSKELSIILCTSTKDDIADDLDLPVPVLEIVKEHNLQLFVAPVPERPARTREEWEMQCQLWPTTFHPNVGKPAESLDLHEGIKDTMCAFMEMAIEQARLARENGQLANGAVIVDPALGTVVATGYDRSNGRSLTDPLYAKRGSSDGNQETVADSGMFRVSSSNPLRHAVMEAIDMAAERDRRLWPDEHCQAMNGHNRDENASTNSRRLRRDEDVQVGFFTESCRSSCSAESEGETTQFEITRPYLCTDWDLYVAREPCAMCAMAMVHQRIRRVIYGMPSPHVGALGSQFKLHSLPSLNHHYSVFRIILKDEDLM